MDMFFILAKNIENTKMVYAATSYNRSVYAAPAVVGLASIRPGQSPTAPSHVSFQHIWAGGLCCAKPFYARPNVVNSLTVMRNTAEIFLNCIKMNKNILTK